MATKNKDFLDIREDITVKSGINTTALYSTALKAKNLLINENKLTKIKRKYILFFLQLRWLINRYF